MNHRLISRLTAAALAIVTPMLHAATWDYSTTKDKMTDATTHIARLDSSNSLDLPFPYAGANPGRITVRQHPTYGLDVMVVITKGQIQCGVSDCTIRIRLDGAKATNWQFAKAADGDSTVIFARAPRKLLPQLQKAKTAVVELPIFHAGNQLLEFSMDAPLKWEAGTAKPTTKGKK